MRKEIKSKIRKILSSIDCNAIDEKKLERVEELWGVGGGTGIDAKSSFQIDSFNATEVEVCLMDLGLDNDEKPPPEKCEETVYKLIKLLDEF